MEQDPIEIQERRISRDRSKNFRGTVSVSLEVLDFDVEGAREPSKENEETLRGKFRTDHCFPFRPENRISAIIDQQSLEKAIQLSDAGTSLATLLENPDGIPPKLRLPPNHRLKCLQGRSRVQAAKNLLPPRIREWAVDLYLEDASPELRTWLIEQYADVVRFSDAEIYQKMRLYKTNKYLEGRWRTRLSSNKQISLKPFLKHGAFPAAFDALFVIPGLSEFRIGMIPELMAMRCDDMILHKLKDILQTWEFILDGNQELMGLIEKPTVEALQLRVPGLCSGDAEFLEGLMSKGVLFPRVKSQQKLQRILRNLLKVKCPIPTVWSFFEDIKYLIPLSKIMKQLFWWKDFDGTINEAMTNRFTNVNQSGEEIRVQETESTFRSYRGNDTDRKGFGIFQLWLSLARNSTDMITKCPKKEKGQAQPLPKTPEASVWHAVAVLAYNLGFESEEIHRLRSKNLDLEIAHAELLKARKTRLFKDGEMSFDFFVNGPGESIKRRCGRTFENAYANDRQCLFLKAFSVSDHVGGQGITSLFVRVSLFRAFFGGPVHSNAGGSDTPTALLNALGTPVGPENRLFPLQQVAQMSTSLQRSEQESRLAEETDRLRIELTRANEDLSKMRRDTEELARRKVHVEETVRGLKAEATDMRTEHEAHFDVLQSARSENQKLTATCVELELKLRRLEAVESKTSEELRGENEKLLISNDEVQRRLETSERAREDALKEALIDKHKILDNNEDLHRQIQRLSTEKNELQQSLEESERTQSDTLKDILSKKEELFVNNEKLHEENQQLLTRSNELQENLKKLERTQSDTLKDVLSKKEELFISNENLQQDLENLERSRATRSDALEAVSTENKKLLASSQGILDEKGKLSSKIDEVQRSLEKSQRALGEVSSENGRLLASNKELLDENQKLLSKIIALEQDLSDVSNAASTWEEKFLANDNELQRIYEMQTLFVKPRSDEEDLRTEAAVLKDERVNLERILAKLSQLETARLERTAEVANLQTSLSESLQKTEEIKESADAELHRRIEIEEVNRVTKSQLIEQGAELQVRSVRNDMLHGENKSLTAKVEGLEMELAGLREKTNWLIISAQSDHKIPVPDVPTTDPSAKVISFKTFGKDGTERLQSLPMTREVLERMANKHMRKLTRIHLLTEKGKDMSPQMAFDTVVNDGTLTILLVPDGEEVKIDGKLIKFGLGSEVEESRRVNPEVRKIRSVTKPVGSAKERLAPFAGLGTGAKLSNQTAFRPLEEPEQPSAKKSRKT